MTASAVGASTAPTVPLDTALAPPVAPTAASDHRDGPGRLRVDPRVIRKLAAQAAREVDGVSEASIGPIGRAIHHPVPAGTPADQLAIDLEATVSVDYPRSLPVIVERLAAHVARRVEELAGRPVRRFAVRIEHLGTVRGAGRPRVR